LSEESLILEAYSDFNARHLEELLARLSPVVEWANGMEGGHLTGTEAVRAYWTRQWAAIDPHVEPLDIKRDAHGRFVVQVHQIVRDLEGKVLVDTIVHHAYRIRDNLIERMDIE
jgi:hypothetical protein